MLLLKSFLAQEIIDFLEREFVAREPEFQQALLNDVSHELKILVDWINKKIAENKNKVK